MTVVSQCTNQINCVTLACECLVLHITSMVYTELCVHQSYCRELRSVSFEYMRVQYCTSVNAIDAFLYMLRSSSVHSNTCSPVAQDSCPSVQRTPGSTFTNAAQTAQELLIVIGAQRVQEHLRCSERRARGSMPGS